MEYLHEEEIVTTSKVRARSLWKTLEWICTEKMHVSRSDTITDLEETCRTIAVYFCREEEIRTIVEDVPRIIQDRAITYARDSIKSVLLLTGIARALWLIRKTISINMFSTNAGERDSVFTLQILVLSSGFYCILMMRQYWIRRNFWTIEKSR